VTHFNGADHIELTTVLQSAVSKLMAYMSRAQTKFDLWAAASKEALTIQPLTPM
jgi:hypothetical protein